MSQAKSLPTPMVSSLKLSKFQGMPTVDPTFYRSIVGALQYVTLTRPEIAYSVNRVCQFMHCPLDEHWKAVKRILRYLAGKLNHGIHFTKGHSLDLVGF